MQKSNQDLGELFWESLLVGDIVFGEDGFNADFIDRMKRLAKLKCFSRLRKIYLPKEVWKKYFDDSAAWCEVLNPKHLIMGLEAHYSPVDAPVVLGVCESGESVLGVYKSQVLHYCI